MASQPRLFAARARSAATFTRAKIALCLALTAVSAVLCSPISASENLTGERFKHFMGFTLSNDTTLAEVQKRFGVAEEVCTGDGGEYECSLCYKGKNGYVQFLSTKGSGLWENKLAVELDGFALSAIEPNDHCSRLADHWYFWKMQVGGVSLGQSQKAFLKAVKDKTSTLETPSLSAVFQYKRPVPEEYKKIHNLPDFAQNYFDGVIEVATEFTEGRLTRLSIRNSETL